MANSRNRARRGASQAHGVRTDRLEALMLEELNLLFDSELQNPLFEDIHITRVELSRDGSRAKLWYGFREAGVGEPLRLEHERVAAALVRATGFVRFRLCDALAMKRAPELRFELDPELFSDRTRALARRSG